MKSKQKAYLCGRMGNNPNDAKWREDITPFLEGLDFEVLNPYKLEVKQLRGLHVKDLPKGYKVWFELKEHPDKNQRDRFLKYMRKIILFDCDIVKDKADILVGLWDEGCKTGAGTASELTLAFLSRKPIFVVATVEMPLWAYGCCTRVFSSFEELRAFLLEEYGDGTETVEGDLVN
jgi:hypothetical protein